MKKKEYETPKMSTIDFEYKTSLLAGSCCTTTSTYHKTLSFNFDDIINDPKA